MTTHRMEIAVVGSGFAGSLIARILAVQGRAVMLVERGTHPRFAIGESSTPLANLSLERLARRYGLTDCYHLAGHGRWIRRYPDLRRGLKRGFTFYRHHHGSMPDARQVAAERLLVAASPDDAVADSHWMRSDVDHHFVRMAIDAGVDYRDRVELTHAEMDASGGRLIGQREGQPIQIQADFVIDATGPGGFLARQLNLASATARMRTRSGLLFSHFSDVALIGDAVPGLPESPYPEDWAAVHHIIDEGWMYSLRFDNGITSAGFALNRAAGMDGAIPDVAWRKLLSMYPLLDALFGRAKPLFPIAWRARMQHRLTRAAGERWVLMPHAYAFVDPLFSTGIAWSLRSVERLASCFEHSGALPTMSELSRYESMLSAEADQIDTLIAGAYEAMAHFDLFAAHAMIYFAAVSFAETRLRLQRDDHASAWMGFLGVGDAALGPLPAASLRRLRRITRGRALKGTRDDRRRFAEWIAGAIAPRNVAGLADPARHNAYPVDLDALVDRHALLDLTREQLVAALPALRGLAPEPQFAE